MATENTMANRQYYSSQFSIPLQDQLVFEEGKVNHAYPDPKHPGILTIGIGHNLIARPKWANGTPIAHTLTDMECFKLLAEDLTDTQIQLLDHWIGVKSMSSGARRNACIAMCFQLGIGAFMKFVNMRRAVEYCNWEEAYASAIDSDWARDPLTHARAMRVAGQLRTGTYYDIPTQPT